jgi:hypothetical protein
MTSLQFSPMGNGFIGCAICGKPLRLAAAKSENGGLPIHEECYQLRLKLKQAPTPCSKPGETIPVLAPPVVTRIVVTRDMPASCTQVSTEETV